MFRRRTWGILGPQVWPKLWLQVVAAAVRSLGSLGAGHHGGWKIHEWICYDLGLSENSVPLNPLDIQRCFDNIGIWVCLKMLG